LGPVIWEANAKGKLSVASLLLLQACFGANDDRYRRISLLNHVVSKTQVKSTDGSAVQQRPALCRNGSTR